MFSCHSLLECYNLFSGVKLSIESFSYISVSGISFFAGGSVVPQGNLKSCILQWLYVSQCCLL